jgi:hypothetical protein
LGTVGDHLIRIVCQDGKNFRAVGCSEVRSARTDCDFALAGGTSVAQGVDQVRAESFHRLPASNPSG